MTITYCCYGAYADIGHSEDCPEAAKRRVEASGSPELRDLRATFGNWPVSEVSGLVRAKPRAEPVAWQARKLKDGKDWGPPGTNKKVFDQLAAEGYEIRALGVLA